MKLLMLPVNHFYLKFRAKLFLVKFNVTHRAAIFNRLRGRRSLPCPALPPPSAVPSRRPQPSPCHGFARYKLCMWLSAIVPCNAVYVVVGHRAVGLLQVVVTSPCRGGAAKIYNWHYYVPLLQERLLQRSFLIVLDSSLCPTARWGILHPLSVWCEI